MSLVFGMYLTLSDKPEHQKKKVIKIIIKKKMGGSPQFLAKAVKMTVGGSQIQDPTSQF